MFQSYCCSSSTVTSRTARFAILLILALAVNTLSYCRITPVSNSVLLVTISHHKYAPVHYNVVLVISPYCRIICVKLVSTHVCLALAHRSTNVVVASKTGTYRTRHSVFNSAQLDITHCRLLMDLEYVINAYTLVSNVCRIVQHV